jgi:hypothetical protein
MILENTLPKPFADRIPFAKIATILAVAIGISLGLCGIGMSVGNRFDQGSWSDQIFMRMVQAGMILFWLSILGLILMFVVWVATSIIQSFTRE